MIVVAVLHFDGYSRIGHAPGNLTELSRLVLAKSQRNHFADAQYAHAGCFERPLRRFRVVEQKMPDAAEHAAAFDADSGAAEDFAHRGEGAGAVENDGEVVHARIVERKRERYFDGDRSMSHDKSLRELLARVLDWGDAHIRFEAAVKDFPPELRGVRPAGGPHSAWELLEHLRIAQWDILEFSRDPKHVSPKFPSGYWPASPEPPHANAWDESVASFRADLKALAAMAKDPSLDLEARIPHGDGQTVLREILLTADHNAYHLGQLVMVRRMLGA